MPGSLKFLLVLVAGALLGVGAYSASGLNTPTTSTLGATASEATTSSSSAPSPSTTTTTSSTTTTTTAPKGALLIHGTGDVAVDPVYIPDLAQMGYDHAWSGLDGLFQRDDLTVINLECVPSDIGVEQERAFNFRCPTSALPSIRDNGIEVTNLANNHSSDYGMDALIDGRQQILDAGMSPVGTGADAHIAGEPALFEINGWKVAVLGFGGVAPYSSMYATASSPGMRSGDDTPSMVRAVEAAEELADIVVVSIHWGRELDTKPRPDDIQRAAAMVAAGADVIFGHHQHRLGPLEHIDGKPVFWGLGNFVWPHNSTASATTAVARVVVNSDGSLTACMIDAFIKTHGRPVITGDAACGPPV